MSVNITPYIIRKISSDKFKGKLHQKMELMSKVGQKGVSHFELDRKLKEMGYDNKERKKLVNQMCDLADERKQQNIKASRRLNITMNSDEGAGTDFMKRRFAQDTGQSKRELALKAVREKAAKAKKEVEMNTLGGKASYSALGDKGSKKAGFAGKLEEKKTGFASQMGSSKGVTGQSGGQGVASGFGSNPSGNTKMKL